MVASSSLARASNSGGSRRTGTPSATGLVRAAQPLPATASSAQAHPSRSLKRWAVDVERGIAFPREKVPATGFTLPPPLPDRRTIPAYTGRPTKPVSPLVARAAVRSPPRARRGSTAPVERVAAERSPRSPLRPAPSGLPVAGADRGPPQAAGRVPSAVGGPARRAAGEVPAAAPPG